jgi:3-hydroxyisobutyrate dehydrogenase-like beta-hydroxyacid dehydrogenase
MRLGFVGAGRMGRPMAAGLGASLGRIDAAIGALEPSE